jgi:hypothetical protein
MINPNDLTVDASYSYRTYLGSLEGAPSVAVMIESAKQQVKKLWGERTIFLIDPIVKGKFLPRWTHILWATGPAKDEEMHGSELVILWYSELPPETDRVLSAVDWEKHAKDFQY